jgi:hypothetical protein
MTLDEPSIFQELHPYTRARLMLASAVLFRKSNWDDWSYGHEKLLGIILWNYETKKQSTFKYSKLLKRHAYGRTQNYKLLKGITERNILVKQGNGNYSFSEKYRALIDAAFQQIRILDQISKPEEVRPES